jgi:hypothetical protein
MRVIKKMIVMKGDEREKLSGMKGGNMMLTQQSYRFGDVKLSVACLVKGNEVSTRILSAQTEMNRVPGSCTDYIHDPVIMRNGDDKENYKFEGWKRMPINALRYCRNICED